MIPLLHLSKNLPRYLFHGTRNITPFEKLPRSFIGNKGELLLNPSSNFGGRQIGVSFSPEYSVARDYASRFQLSPSPARYPEQGGVFRVNTSGLDLDNLIKMDSSEIMVPGLKQLVIPPNKWKLIRDKKSISKIKKQKKKQEEQLKELDDETLVDEFLTQEQQKEARDYWAEGGQDFLGDPVTPGVQVPFWKSSWDDEIKKELKRRHKQQLKTPEGKKYGSDIEASLHDEIYHNRWNPIYSSADEWYEDMMKVLNLNA
tara:strand:- start:661 stop:1434 length:774 start_codon:yes stop_codon:yes gene_type:complete